MVVNLIQALRELSGDAGETMLLLIVAFSAKLIFHSEKSGGGQSNQAERMLAFPIVERDLREVVWFFVMIRALDGLKFLHTGGHLVLATLPF